MSEEKSESTQQETHSVERTTQNPGVMVPPVTETKVTTTETKDESSKSSEK